MIEHTLGDITTMTWLVHIHVMDLQQTQKISKKIGQNLEEKEGSPIYIHWPRERVQ